VVADKLASEYDLATWLQQDVDTASATLALELATGSIQNECGWRILAETVTDLLVTPAGHMVTLPTARLTALAMTDNGQTLVQGNTMLWSPNGLVLRKAYNGLIDYPFIGPVIATFTHGYPVDSVPQAIRGCACSSRPACTTTRPGCGRRASAPPRRSRAPAAPTRSWARP
jgi:hypothetical protein